MTDDATSGRPTQPIGVIPFVTELARYFMDFLETDFHKVRNPKRNIQSRNKNNLQISINLNKYAKFTARAWRLIKDGFDGESLSHLRRGDFTTAIPKSLLSLIQSQIELIGEADIRSITKLFQNEIDIGIAKHPNDTTAAITYALDGVALVVRERFLKGFVERIKEPIEKFQTATVDSIYQIEEELTDILVRPLEDAVSSIINHIVLEKSNDREEQIGQVFETEDIKNKLESFFNGFAAGDLFSEVSEIFNNKSLLENQEFYFYFCDISYRRQVYPLFYIPIALKKGTEGFEIAFDQLVYVNKKAVQFITQDYNAEIARKGTISSFLERIIYLSEDRAHFIGTVDLALKELVNYFGLEPYIDINNPERQVAKGPQIHVSNNCYIGLFDKSDESLINDYEEILQKLKLGDNDLALAFQTLIDDFITNNPTPIVSQVDDAWDNAGTDEKLVYASPVPLNEEQRKILSALGNTNCKYVSVEGPPGTGKSHTITAIACDAVLKNQSILILSDKKEALDVVEDKITQTLNKVRLDNQFQNPILRLGQAGNTYSKILSTTSMERIKEHYRVVRNDYKKLEATIGSSINSLKSNINGTIEAYDRIKLPEIVELEALETHVTSDETLPISLTDGHISKESLAAVRQGMIVIKKCLSDQDGKLGGVFRAFYPQDHSQKAFHDFFTILAIVDEVRVKSAASIHLLSKINGFSEGGLSALAKYISQYVELKSGLFGLLFKRRQIETLNRELSNGLPNDFDHPQSHLNELKELLSIFRNTQQLKHRHELEGAFKFNGDFVACVYKLLTLPLKLPNHAERKAIVDVIASITAFLGAYKATAQKMGISSNDIFSFGSNALVGYPQEEFDKLTRYLGLRANLEANFASIPEQNYLASKKEMEELVTTQMTYKMDERVVGFYENYRNDAKTLASVISKKQKFDRESFGKLKQSFPCILAGIRDFAEFIPLESNLFDLVIIDEASQVSIAQAFPALLRGTKVIVLGDHKQFSNVKSSQARSDTNREYLNRLRDVFVHTISEDTIKIARLEKFNIKTSILEFSDRISNFHIMLKKHFRGYRELISYSSKYFYNDDLQAIKIRATPIESVIKFQLVEHDGKIETIDNSNKPEMQAIVQEVERISREEENRSIAIITPHTNQQKLLVDAFSKHRDYERFTEHHKLKIMTFDTCQGEERDIVLYSMVASGESDKLWGVFIKDLQSVDLEEGGQIKAQRLNVGFSRSKERMHFFLSKPIEEFSGAVGEALSHYKTILEQSKKLPSADSTDARSPMERKVLHWLQEAPFFKSHRENIELHTQFHLADYIKQLDRRYKHPSYVVDFLLLYTDSDGLLHRIVIEYDGFEFHFRDRDAVNKFNFGEYYTESDIYREKVLESYGYEFLRLNRFNVGKDPVSAISTQLYDLVKKKTLRAAT